MRKILIHICCGTCAIIPVIELQKLGFEPILIFYNPNIHPLNEYLKRRHTAQVCAGLLNVPIIYEDKDWDFLKWISNLHFKYNAPLRCNICISERIKKICNIANNLKISCFTSSLLYSIYQPHSIIYNICKQNALSNGLEFIYYDFRNLWKLGQKLAQGWKFYRQNYCGCLFSEKERNISKL